MFDVPNHFSYVLKMQPALALKLDYDNTFSLVYTQILGHFEIAT